MIFMWYGQRRDVLTKDDFEQLECIGSYKFSFCDHYKMVQHLFLYSPLQ